ncbi:flagellar hook protein FliD [Xenophilus sp. AP218F]|nr:flagellar hook protein FliD [Xenophilus sp. AP218F]
MWAQNLASARFQGSQTQIDAQNKSSKARNDALGQLQKTLQDFRGSLTSLTGKKSPVAMNASALPEGVVVASAKGNAQSGSYSLFVERVAASHQLALGDMDGVAAQAGDQFSIKLKNGDKFDVKLDGADSDKDGKLSATELALAINRASGNGGKVSAMVLNSGGKSQVVLSAGKTGKDNALELDLSALDKNDALKAALGAQTTLSEGRDALVWLGEKGKGVKIEQGSNTLDNIEGVSLTLNKAMKDGDAPLQLAVSRNEAETNANVQSFIDGYNKLLSTVGSLTSAGKDGKNPAPFTGDSSISGLRSQVNSLLRSSYQGVTLTQLGVSASRDGTLTLDSKKLNETLKNQPDALDRYFNGSDKNGALKAVSDYLDRWTNASSGLIKQRKDSEERLSKDLDRRQANIQKQFEDTYQRYLAQFTKLQAMQDQMSQTMSMLM